LRAKLTPRQITSLAIVLPHLSGKEFSLLAQRYPKTYSDLFSTPQFSSIDCDREIAWGLGLILRDTTKLGRFLEYRANFDRAILIGSWELAKNILRETESELGVSLWLLESKIALLQLAEGLESQKQFAKTVSEECIERFPGFIAYFTSQRNEGTINPVRFSKQLRNDMQSARASADFSDYLMYRLADEIPLAPTSIANVLRHESLGSIFDFYETFLRLAMHSISVNACAHVPQYIPSLKTLAETVTDPRLARSLFVLGEDDTALNLAALKDLAPFNAFALGSLENCVQMVLKAVEGGNSDLSLAILLAHAQADQYQAQQPSPGQQSGIYHRVVELAHDLVSKSNTFNEAYFEMLRLALNMKGSQFSASLKSFALVEASNQQSIGGPRELFAFMNGADLDVTGIRCLPQTARSKYARTLLDRYGSQPSVQVAVDRSGIEGLSNRYDGTPPYSPFIYDEILIEDALLESNWPAAIVIADKLIDSKSTRRRRRALRLRSYALLRDERIDELVQCIAENCVSDKGVIPFMPIERCVRSLDKVLRRRLSPQLSLPIVFDLCSRHYSDDFDNFRSYAYEDFLIAQGLSRPSQLRGRESAFDNALLIYYLANLCTPEIMRISRAFKSSKDLENERLAVCGLLIEMDPENTEVYDLEIQKITRSQLIQRAIGQVDKSKIFIDTAAVRRWADKELKESFARYQTLLRAGMDAGAEGFFEEFRDALRNQLAGVPIDKNVLALPKNEASDLLVTMVSRFLTECLSSPQHGLDCYLSMQIRHGSLSGQLRLPLEEERIITQRDSTRLEYKRNDYWLSRMSDIEPNVRDRIDVAIRRFSQDYDALVDNFKDDLIQIKSKEKQHGLFTIEVTQLIVRGLATGIKSETKFEEFVDVCFQLFWDSLEPSLSSVRNAIDQSLKPKMNQLFTELEAELAAFERAGSLSELNNAIRFAQTKAQGAIDRVQDWFRLGKYIEKQVYTLEDFVEIGLQYVTNIHQSFDPRVTMEIAQSPPFEQLIVFTNIFFLIFENISRHSGLHRPDIAVAAEILGDSLHINVTSECANHIHAPESIVRVDRIKGAIAEGGYLRAVRSEGGTGLMKLHNIIRADIYPTNKLTFGFTGRGRFEVDLVVGIRTV
jgi:hypothetical protein